MINKENQIFETYFNLSKNLKKSFLNNISNYHSKIKYSYKFNGRWENQYLNIEFVPEIKTILDYACQTGATN